jgi:hypothetical protein
VSAYTPPVQALIDELGRLPGVGPKSAQRIAFHLLKTPNDDVRRLAHSIIDAKEKARFCDICFNIAENNLCPICEDHRRDSSVLCVVEDSRDVVAIEKTGAFRGRYHVLQGAIHPMEGWDGLADGNPSDNTRRRWTLFGRSGAKMIWGGEAVAVRHDGRANPKQLVLNAQTQSGIAQLREGLVQAHRESMGSDKGLVIGLQLTHSGRFCKPNLENRMEPRGLYQHPPLPGRVGPKQKKLLMSHGEILIL